MRIQRRGGLIQQDHLWAHCDGARDAQALLLPTREAGAALVELFLDLVPQGSIGQRLFHPVIQCALGGMLVESNAEGHIVVDAHGKRCRFLEDHADAPAQLIYIDTGAQDVGVIQQHLAHDPMPGVELVDTIQNPQQGGFATAGWANEGSHLVLGNIEIDMLQRLMLAIIEGQIPDAHLRAGWLPVSVAVAIGKEG